ncbi:MAG: RNA-splicing ligase RtcB, partial [Thermoprotei archaeon ex4572_64]
MNGYNFYMPELKVSKVKELERSAIEYLEDIKKLLEEFDITSTISKVYEENGKVIYRLLIHENSENLIKLWSKINYEYNRERRKLANAAVIYLRLKEKLKYIRKIIRSTCKSIDGKKSVLLASKIALNGGVINERFIERSLYENVENARIPKNFITFEEFARNYVYGEVVYDYVEDVDIEEYNDVVYDLTVNDDSHNFIANNFIVHNCGVRLLVTNLSEKDVRPRLRELVDTIFRLVPAGVGETGLLRLSFSELDKVL